MTKDRSKLSPDEEKRETLRRQQLAHESQDADLSEALDDSFPASDPPSMTAPKTRVGAPKGDRRTTEKK